MRRRESTIKPARGPLTEVEIDKVHIRGGDGSDVGTIEIPRLAFASSAARTPISMVMSREVIDVRRDRSVASLTTLLLEKNLPGTPVLDADGTLAGFVSMADLVRHRSEEMGEGFHAGELARTTVEELMVSLSISLTESAPLTMAAAIMFLEGVHQIPVVSDDEKVVGILSALDVLGWLAREDGYQMKAARLRWREAR